MAYELQDFQEDVIEAGNTVPVVIDFWADWCGPCRQLSPILEKLAGEAKGRWKLIKIDTEKNPDIAAQFGIRGIPAVKMVFQQQIVAEFTGAQPEHLVRKWLDENLPDNEEDASGDILQQVDELLARGERERASTLLGSYINEDSAAEEKALYAMLLLPDHLTEAQKWLGTIESGDKYEIEFQTSATVRHLKDISDDVTEPEGALEQATDAYVSGCKALFKYDFEEALQQFIRSLQLDRTMDEEGPRKACISCFTLLTPHHPLTLKYRRQFSMSLY